MAKHKAPAQKTVQEKVKMVSDGARLLDAVLALVFAVIAYKTGHWFWWASSAFCVLTVLFKPLERLHSGLRQRLLKVSQGR